MCRPREAKSVATRVSTFPFFRSTSACSRLACGSCEWRAALRSPFFSRSLAIVFSVLISLQKTRTADRCLLPTSADAWLFSSARFLFRKRTSLLCLRWSAQTCTVCSIVGLTVIVPGPSASPSPSMRSSYTSPSCLSGCPSTWSASMSMVATRTVTRLFDIHVSACVRSLRGKVAEKSRTWRLGRIPRKIAVICDSKPSANMRSASSSTR
mmetsp:Transcript_4703/g.12824  ORF Transcript_4703/g.12824 Transcript_4703/m.12824 type:complete len:210 (+) Transcript_4703:105-734(+)